MKKIIFAICALALIAGCSKSADNNSQKNGVPATLDPNFEVQAQKSTPVSIQAKQQLRELMQLQNAKMPTISLIDGTAMPVEKRHRRLAQLDSDGQTILRSMQNDCRVNHQSQPTHSGNLYGNNEAVAIDGANCPIRSDTKEVVSIVASSVDSSTGGITGTISVSSDLDLRVVDHVVASRARYLANTLWTRANGALDNFRQDRGGTNVVGRMYLNGIGGGKIQFDEVTKGTLEFTVESLQSANTKDLHVRLKLFLFDEVFDIALIKEGGSERYYMNGDPITREEALGYNLDVDDFVEGS